MRVGAIWTAILAVGVAGLAWWNPLALQDWLRDPQGSFLLVQGENPHPVKLRRPAAAPLSAMARLGRQIFFDARLSSSGRLSCASCHDPAHDYAAPGWAAGGANLSIPAVRAVPSLMYLERQPPFSIGPDQAESEGPPAAAGGPRAVKSAADPAAASANPVPQGGLFWDGRADTLQNQAMIPLLNPAEMDGGSAESVAQKLKAAPYAAQFVTLFGPGILSDPRLLASEAMFAVGRFEIEDASFHPYASKYDAWLEGRARLSGAELRGMLAFNDPSRGNCAACHLSRPSPDGLPPLFTDHQFEALGVPRNTLLRANRDPAHFDLGLCGSHRQAVKDMAAYCGFFATPSLRNVARRHVFFHNGIYSSLRQVLDFYNFRDVQPQRVYPVVQGKAAQFNDLPPVYRVNVDKADAPFARAAPMSAGDEEDIIAFLQTLTDQPRRAGRP